MSEHADRGGPRTAPSLGDIDWPVNTERLLIRPSTADDVDAVWAYRRLDEVNQWLSDRPGDHDQFREAFLPRLPRTLVVARGDAPELIIGDLMVRIEDAWAQQDVADRAVGVQAELGWVLHPDHTGHGYATEAVRAVIEICFTGLGLRRVTANCFLQNEPSWRLMQRLGMRRELHTRKESLHRDLGWLDGLGYALLAEEWSAG